MNKEIKHLRDLTLDAKNANRHTQRGEGMLESSLEECGFGDSIVVDKNGVIISGESRTLRCVDMGLENVVVVKTHGDQPVIHQRLDLDLLAGADEDPRARRLSLLSNQVAFASYDVDPAKLAEVASDGFKFDDMFSSEEMDAIIAKVNSEVEQQTRDMNQSMTDALDNLGGAMGDDTISCTCSNCGHEMKLLKDAFGMSPKGGASRSNNGSKSSGAGKTPSYKPRPGTPRKTT